VTDDPKETKDPTSLSTIPSGDVERETGSPASQPVAAQQEMLPGFSGGGRQPSMMMGLQVTNPEAEIIKKVTPEHIARAIETTHEIELRRLDLNEKELQDQCTEAERRHARDDRDRTDLKQGDDRLERMFYVVFGAVVLMAAGLFFRDKEELALKLVGAFIAVLITLVGGMGLETARQARKRKRETDSSGE
jgi:hypothetical protein